MKLQKLECKEDVRISEHGMNMRGGKVCSSIVHRLCFDCVGSPGSPVVERTNPPVPEFKIPACHVCTKCGVCSCWTGAYHSTTILSSSDMRLLNPFLELIDGRWNCCTCSATGVAAEMGNCPTVQHGTHFAFIPRAKSRKNIHAVEVAFRPNFAAISTF